MYRVLVCVRFIDHGCMPVQPVYLIASGRPALLNSASYIAPSFATILAEVGHPLAQDALESSMFNQLIDIKRASAEALLCL